MKIKPSLTLLTSLLFVSAVNPLAAQPAHEAAFDSFTKPLFWYTPQLINTEETSIEGDSKVIQSSLGPTVTFDGDGDRLVVDKNPIFGAEEFTIEVIIYPNNAYPENTEPRYFHIESADNGNRRITMEMRLNDQEQWYMDAFIKSDNDKFTLIDPTLVHPIEQWAHTAITYKDGTFSSYVNGKKELSAQVEYLPIAENARTSIGARLNQVHWFNGHIHSIAATPKALEPEDFKILAITGFSNEDFDDYGYEYVK